MHVTSVHENVSQWNLQQMMLTSIVAAPSVRSQHYQAHHLYITPNWSPHVQTQVYTYTSLNMNMHKCTLYCKKYSRNQLSLSNIPPLNLSSKVDNTEHKTVKYTCTCTHNVHVATCYNGKLTTKSSTISQVSAIWTLLWTCPSTVTCHTPNWSWTIWNWSNEEWTSANRPNTPLNLSSSVDNTKHQTVKHKWTCTRNASTC